MRANVAARRWPPSVAPESVERYEDAARELRKSPLGREDGVFDVARKLAVHQCERARDYDWALTANQRDRLRDVFRQANWQRTARAARRLASALEKADGLYGLMIVKKAVDDAGVTFTWKPDELPQHALARLLRSVAKQRYKLSRGGGEVRHGMGEVHYGGLSIRTTKALLRLPRPPEVLTLILTHVFRKLSDPAGDAICIDEGEPLATGGQPCWSAAAAFAAAAFEGDRVDELEAAAKKWHQRYRGRLRFIGWPTERGPSKK